MLFSTGYHIIKISVLEIFSNCNGFPGASDGKESTCNTRDLSSIPRLGRSSGEGNGNPLLYSCLENSMDRGAWQGTVHGVIKTTKLCPQRGGHN